MFPLSDWLAFISVLHANTRVPCCVARKESENSCVLKYSNKHLILSMLQKTYMWQARNLPKGLKPRMTEKSVKEEDGNWALLFLECHLLRTCLAEASNSCQVDLIRFFAGAIRSTTPCSEEASPSSGGEHFFFYNCRVLKSRRTHHSKSGVSFGGMWINTMFFLFRGSECRLDWFWNRPPKMGKASPWPGSLLARSVFRPHVHSPMGRAARGAQGTGRALQEADARAREIYAWSSGLPRITPLLEPTKAKCSHCLL